MKNFIALLFCAVFVLSACGHEGMQDESEVVEEPTEGEVVVEEADNAEDVEEVEEEKEEAVAPTASVGYAAYSDGVVGNGEPSLLFFYASWCPKCQTNDGLLTDAYDAGKGAISTYKVDYDTADALKEQFGVVQQDTFVLIDGDGNVVKTAAFPSKEELHSLIQ